MAAPLPQPIDILVARNRIGDAARRTPLQSSATLAEASGAAEVRMKLEHLQNTGSFKIRGAWNKVAAVAETDPRARLVTASTGNHGIAVAHAAAHHRMSVTILVGAASSPAKLERLRALESDSCVVEVFGRDSDDTEAEARRRDLAGQAIYVPPYNDPVVIAGQGTVGLEILEEWPEVDTVVVPMGGGGLISGIGLWMKTVNPRIRLVGVQPEASPPFAAQRVTGSTKPIPIGPTLADGVAGNVERGSITWKLSQRLVDEIVLVSEAEIAQAMGWALRTHRHRLEGSGALSIAAIAGEHLGDLAGRRVAAVISGGNVDDDTFRTATVTVG